MKKITGSNIYFCDPASPNQKPLVERMNRDIRHWFAKGTDFNPVTQQEIDLVFDIINEKLRPVLNWRTAKEVFLDNFKQVYLNNLINYFSVC